MAKTQVTYDFEQAKFRWNTSLTYLSPMQPFFTSLKHQKTLRFLMFSGNRERVHWEQMV